MFGLKRWAAMRAATEAALAEAQYNAAAQYARNKVRDEAQVTIERELRVSGLTEAASATIRDRAERYHVGVEKAYKGRYEMKDALGEREELVRLGAAHFVSARNLSILSGSYDK